MKIRQLIGSPKRRLIAAFSIVEATVGFGILAMAAAALMTGITAGFFGMQMARENLRATQVMLEKVETLRLCNWDQVNTNFIRTSFTNYYDPNSTNNMGLAYRGTISIGNVPFTNSYSTNMRQVTITLNWNTGNLPRSRTYSTFVARDGLQNYIF